MPLGDLECQNRGFYGFFWQFLAAKHISRAIASKSIEIYVEMLRMKISALNVNFSGLNLDLLGSKKSAHEGIKKRYPCKSH